MLSLMLDQPTLTLQAQCVVVPHWQWRLQSKASSMPSSHRMAKIDRSQTTKGDLYPSASGLITSRVIYVVTQGYTLSGVKISPSRPSLVQSNFISSNQPPFPLVCSCLFFCLLLLPGRGFVAFQEIHNWLYHRSKHQRPDICNFATQAEKD